MTISHTKSNTDATVVFLDSSDQAFEDADTSTEGHQLNLDLGGNTIKFKVTAPDSTTVRVYTLVVIRDTLVNVCGRTAQVRDAILSASGVTECADVTEGHLAGITDLNLTRVGITSLKSGDFDGLTALESLNLSGNEIISLPDGVFSQLAALEELVLGGNNLGNLPVGIFSGLKALIDLNLYQNRLAGLQREHFAGLDSLTSLNLGRNGLVNLPADVFDELTGLESIALTENRFRSLPPQLFSRLSALKHLHMLNSRITELPAGIFSGLTEIERVYLHDNQLSRLPDGLFVGMTKLRILDLRSNKIDPLPLPISLEPLSQNQFKLVVPTGAPFPLSVPVTVSSAGEIQGGATSVTIPQGAIESAPLTVTRVSGTTDAIAAEFDSNLDMTARHRGYNFTKNDPLAKQIVPSTAPTEDAALRSLSVSPGVLDSTFDPATTSYSVSVSNAVSSLTLTPTTSGTSATVTFLDASDSTLPDADAATDGFQASPDAGDNTIKVRVTAEDATTTRTYTLVVTRNSAPVITTTSPVTVQENVTRVAVLTATDSDGDYFTWLTNGGADAALFHLTSGGRLTFESAPDFEEPDDLDEDNEYVVVVEASDGLDVSYLTLLVKVTDVDDGTPESDDASLSALSLSDGALDPAFASETASYTAKVGAEVSSITVTSTSGDANAIVAYLDSSDQALDDADDSTEGHQVDLNPGRNTIQVRVTAEDTTTNSTYTLVVTRNRAPVITTVSPLPVNENETAVATLAATDADGDAISWSTNGGTDAGQFELTEYGELTFTSAPDYESAADSNKDNAYVVAVQASDGADITFMTLTVEVADVEESEPLSDDAGLATLLLSSGNLSPVFALSVTDYAVTLANAVSSITVTPTTSHASAAVAYLNENDQTLDDADQNAAGHQVDLAVGANTFKVRVTAEDTTTTQTYTVVVTRESITAVSGNVCGRTEQVRDAIVGAIAEVGFCADVTEAHLSRITLLDLGHDNISSLKPDDLAGLTGLSTLHLHNNELSGFPSGLFSEVTALRQLVLSQNRLGSLAQDTFSGLTALELLALGRNDLTSLPDGVFSGLSALEQLSLAENSLSTLPSGIFSGLSALRILSLQENQFDSLPADVFSGLDALETLTLQLNRLTSLPSGVFSGLNSLEVLRLDSNRLSSLPNGLFSRLAVVERLELHGNAVDPLPLALSLEKVGDDQFKAVAPSGAPFDLELPVVVNSAGELDGDASALTIAAGATESGLLTAKRVAGVNDAVTVRFGPLPDLPERHQGYVPQEDAALPREILPLIVAKSATLSDLSLSEGTLDPSFSEDQTRYAASTEHTVSSITVTPTANDPDATVSYLDENENEKGDDDESKEGYQLNLDVGENTIKIQVKAVDGATTLTYTVVITRQPGAGVCGRTAQVRDAIVAAVTGIDDCSNLTQAHLSAITELDVSDTNLTSLNSEDLAGLTALESLHLQDNQLSGLPSNLFSGLIKLRRIHLYRNRLSSLPSDVFSGLTALESLVLSSNRLGSIWADQFDGLTALTELLMHTNNLGSLPPGVFSDLTELEHLDLKKNQLRTLPSGVFAGLTRLEVLTLELNQLNSLSAGVFSDSTALESLALNQNRLTALPAGLFSGLTRLEFLGLTGNRLSSLPEETFSGLTSLRTLQLQDTGLSSLPSGLFSGLTALERINLAVNNLNSVPANLFSGLSRLDDLQLNVNNLTELPAGLFSGLSALTILDLAVNELSDLPDGVFSGLSGLATLRLDRNDVDPLPLPFSLEKVGDDQFKAVAPKGAPFAVDVPVSVSNRGTLEGDINNVTILAGAVESSPVEVARVAGSSIEVTVDIGTLPALPAGHLGYVLQKDATLPREILPNEAAEGVCGRTPQVRDAIVALISGVEDCADVTDAQLSAITRFDVSDSEISSLKSGDFAGLTALENLTLRANDLSGLPSDVFSGLSALEVLQLSGNSFSSLPSNVFAGLSALRHLLLGHNQFSSLQSGTNSIFSGLSALESLQLNGNRFVTLPSEFFSGLSKLQSINLNSNQLTSLPADLFTGLDALKILNLSRNHLRTLPDGIFSGLGTFEQLLLMDNSVDPLPFPIALEKVGASQFKAVAPVGAPFALELPVSINSAGQIQDGATSVAISAGSVESNALTVSRVPGSVNAISVDIGTLPARPRFHHGYSLDKSADLPLEILPKTGVSSDATLTDLSVGLRTLEPAFASDTREYEVLVVNTVSSITVKPAKADVDATVAYLDADDAELTDADTNTEGQQVDLDVGKNTIKVKVTAEDSTSTRTYTIVVTRFPVQRHVPVIVTSSPISVEENQSAVATLEATEGDGDEVVWSTRGGADAAQFNLTTDGVLTFVSAPDYESPGDADGNNDYVVDVEASDRIAGTAVVTFTVNVTDVNEGEPAMNDATLSGLSLSSGTLDPAFASASTDYEVSVGSSTTSVTVTPETSNSIATVAYLDVRSGTLADADANTGGQQVDLSVGKNTIRIQVTAQDRIAMETYTIVVNRGSSSGVCARTEQVRDGIVAAISGVDACEDVTAAHLSAITSLDFESDDISSLKSGDFNGLAALRTLLLYGNSLSSLPSGIFSGLTALEDLRLTGNQLASLRSDAFTGLTALKELRLGDNLLTGLPSGIFSGLSALEQIRIYNNDLTSLPSGVFSGLTSLTRIGLGANDLSSLSSDVFSGLTALKYIGLYENELSSLPANIFSGLTALKTIALGSNQLTSLPSGVFSGLTALESLRLGSNQLSSLPDGIFSGLTALDELILSGNFVDPLPISVSLQNVGESEFKAVAPAGAPFDLNLPVSASRAGAIEDDAETVTVSIGEVESSTAGVTRVAGTTDDVTVNIGALPSLPANHSGYILEKDSSLPLGIPSPTEPTQTAIDDATLSDLSVDGTTVRLFSSQGTRFVIRVGPSVSRVTIATSTSNPNATVAHLDANNRDLADVDTGTDGFQSDVGVGQNTLNIKVTAEDGVTTSNYKLIVNRDAELPSAGAEITTESPISVEENQTAVATLAATHRDGHALHWHLTDFLGPFDSEYFNLSEEGVLTFVSAPDFENPIDADQNNEYVLNVFASNGLVNGNKQMTIIITDLDESEEASTDATLSGLSLSDGTFSPTFASGATDYTAPVGSTVSSITVTPTTSDTNATVAYLDVKLASLDDADSNTDGQQVNLSIGKNTIRVQVTAEDGTSRETYKVVVTRGSARGVCARTEQVRDAIVAAVSQVDACEDVTDTHLAGIPLLDLISSNISSLQAGDFVGLSDMSTLYLFNNQLSSLPSGLFSGLTGLAELDITINELSSLPSGLFSGLTSLSALSIGDNKISSLPSGLFSGLTSLKKLNINDNELAGLPSGIFSGLTSLTRLTLGGNKFSTVDAGLFSGLSSLELLWLDRNQLSSLPANVFSGLTKIEWLLLNQNKLSDLPSGVFSDLAALELLWLHGNTLTSLPSGLFSGLTGITALKLGGNSVDPLPLTVSLEKVGSSQFKAVAPTGAPFALDLPVTVSNDGAIDGGASSVTIAAGAAESGAVGVTRNSDTTGAITVNIGTLPDLRSGHEGYTLEKDTSLPLEVLAEQSSAPAEGVAANASYADVNANGRIEADDAMVIYHAFESAGSLGDGESGGTRASRSTLLAGLADAPDPTDAELREMLARANEWREIGIEVGGDLNSDGSIDSDDAMIMYYAFEFENLLGNGETGGTTRFRRSLLSELGAQANASDADLKAMLRNAHALRAAAAEAAQ